MHIYAFILGRKHLLSVAELCAVIGSSGRIIDISSEALIAVLDEPLVSAQESLNRLGGTIKIVEIFNEDVSVKEGIAPAAAEFLIGKFKDLAGKLPYGLSIYSFAERHEIILRKTLNSIKKSLVAADIKGRFINHNFQNLESAAIKGEKLLKKGTEIVAIKGNNKIFVGQTVALQDFESYSHRDFSRPERDPRMGMLPPKLAQIMINLGGYTSLNKPLPEGKTLLDPFCGIGTVLTEGLLLGFNAIGSDIDEIAVTKTGKNIDWTRNLAKTAPLRTRVFAHDAATLNQKDLPELIDLVVTESYLGPPVSRMPLPQNIQRTFQNISDTIVRFFRAMNPLLKKSTPVIICLPFYRDKHHFSFMERIVEKISDTGFSVSALIPEEIKSKFSIPATARPSLMYDRPDQIVGREIFIFTQK